MQLVLKESWKIHYLIWGGWFLMIYFHVTQYRGWIFGFCVSIYNFGSNLVLLVSAKLFSYPCACVVLTTAALWVKLFFSVLSSLHGRTSSDGELCLGGEVNWKWRVGDAWLLHVVHRGTKERDFNYTGGFRAMVWGAHMECLGFLFLFTSTVVLKNRKTIFV